MQCVSMQARAVRQVGQPGVAARRPRAAARRSVCRAEIRGVTVDTTQSVTAAKGFWPDPEYIAKVLPKFPESPIASVDEARVLQMSGGYTILDVRSKMETDKDGVIPGSKFAPLIDVKRTYDAATGGYTYAQTRNEDFMKQVKKRVGGPETPVLVLCDDGTDRAIQALELLDAEGYENIVGIKGGFQFWDAVWDPRGRRRRGQTVYTTNHESGGDAMGIHAAGNGFAPMDPTDETPPSFSGAHTIEWIEYEPEDEE